MADFFLWSKETLVQFAEEATVKLEAQDLLIAELKVQILRRAVKDELAQSVAPDTLPHANDPAEHGRLHGPDTGRRGD